MDTYVDVKDKVLGGSAVAVEIAMIVLGVVNLNMIRGVDIGGEMIVFGYALGLGFLGYLISTVIFGLNAVFLIWDYVWVFFGRYAQYPLWGILLTPIRVMVAVFCVLYAVVGKSSLFVAQGVLSVIAVATVLAYCFCRTRHRIAYSREHGGETAQTKS